MSVVLGLIGFGFCMIAGVGAWDVFHDGKDESLGCSIVFAVIGAVLIAAAVFNLV